MNDITLHNDISFDQLRDVSPTEFYAVDLNGVNPATGYEYEICFFRADEPHEPGIHVSTEKRVSFLGKGSEEQAEGALVDLSQRVRKLSGGIFRIHPFYGGVYGTKIDPVSPGFLVDLALMDEGLSTSIVLSDEGYGFDDKSTREALDIGLTVEVPGPKSQQLLAYLSTPKRNPNQRERDQAVGNDLGERWDAEFHRFNGPQRRWLRRTVPQAMEVTPATVTSLVRNLGDQALFTEVTVGTLRTREAS